MSNNNNLTNVDLQYLRENALITETEFAYKAGDLLIAENPLTGEKRIIGQAAMLNESNKRVLKG